MNRFCQTVARAFLLPVPRRFSVLVAAALLSGTLVAVAQAAQPVVSRTEPLGVVRGETTKMVLHGSRLSDAMDVLFDQPGLEATEIEVDDGKVEVMIKADPEMPPGLYPIQLVTKSGISNLRLIGVGALPVVQEEEPNSDFEEAQKIDLNTTVEGVIKFEDVDYFEVELEEGQTVHVEVEGLRLRHDYRNRIFDPYVAILDERQFTVSESDDAPLLQQDPLCSFTAPEAGTYKIELRDSSFGGNDSAFYRMHVGTFPRPIAVVPAGGQPGDVLDVTLVHPTGDPESPLVTSGQIQLPSEPNNMYPVVTQSDQGISPSPNFVRVNALPLTVESEPNDGVREGNEAVAPGAFCGVIGSPGDVDCFSFEAEKGKKYQVQVYARETLRSPLDSVIRVYNTEFRSVASNDDQGGPDSYVEFTPEETGMHTVRIHDALNRGGPQYAYRIEVTTADPQLTLDRKEIYRNEPHGVAVPKGGAMAMMITAKRENFSGELELQLDNVPEGIQVHTFNMPSNRAEVPVLFTAAPDAADAAALVSVTGKPTDEKLAELSGGLGLRHKLVLGRNRREMWGYDSQRLAVSVADEAPFKIKLKQPGVPLVRRGSMELKVEIERLDDFDGRVSLSTLYRPPGISVNNSRRIDEGKTSVNVPITANANAGIGTWPMILIATYDSGRGTARAVAEPIDLQVEDVAFDFDFPKMAGQQGSEIALQVEVDVTRPFEGEGEIELVGFPPGVSSPEPKQPVTPESTSVTFPLVLAEDAKVGKHKTLNCIARITTDDGVIKQTQGTGELRIDKPLKPKDDKPEKKEKKEEKKDEPKPLSRIEQLRQMKQNDN